MITTIKKIINSVNSTGCRLGERLRTTFRLTRFRRTILPNFFELCTLGLPFTNFFLVVQLLSIAVAS